jgi:hypothetical protein
MNWKNTLCLMKTIAEELLSEMKQGKAIEEQRGDLTHKLHETSTMLKILSSTKTTDRAQELVLRQEEAKGKTTPESSEQ